MRLTAAEAIRFASAVCADPATAVTRWRALAGEKAVGCLPLHLPEEIIDAAGMLPVTLWGDEGALPAPMPGRPPLPRGVAAKILETAQGPFRDLLDAFAVPSGCGALASFAEALEASGDPRPLFHLEFPSSGDAPGAAVRLLDRIEAFREWAEAVSGRAVTDGALEKSIAAFDEGRRLAGRVAERLAGSPGVFSGREYLALVLSASYLPRGAHAEILGAALSRRAGRGGNVPRARVFLAGTLATAPVMDAIDAAGAAVVGDDLARGRRFFTGPTPEFGDPPVALVRRHFGRDPSSSAHGAEPDRIGRLLRRARECGADRVLFLRVAGCGPAGTVRPGFADEAGRQAIPVLDAELDVGGPLRPELKTRIEAFVKGG